MHDRIVEAAAHDHAYDTGNRDNERRTFWVAVLTGITMLGEIIGGLLTGSMALLADGWHMGTHMFALGISLFAYVMARRYASSGKYSYGTGKFGVLAGFTSAIFLGLTAIVMMYESIERFISPVSIEFTEAIVLSTIGLAVNVVSAVMLHGSNSTHHHHHDHGHDHHHHDHNLRAAYMHVIADALTSVLAITALVLGKFFGLVALDPLMGVLGGLLIIRWAYGLMKDTGTILLDGQVDSELEETVERVITEDGDTAVADLHVWNIGSNAVAVTVSLVTTPGHTLDEFHRRLGRIPRIDHAIIEMRTCTDDDCPCNGA